MDKKGKKEKRSNRRGEKKVRRLLRNRTKTRIPEKTVKKTTPPHPITHQFIQSALSLFQLIVSQWQADDKPVSCTLRPPDLCRTAVRTSLIQKALLTPMPKNRCL